MRQLKKPKLRQKDVFEECLSGVGALNLKLQLRLQAVTADIVNAAKDYDAKAEVGTLFQIKPFTGKNDAVVVGGVTKGELKDVYTTYMVKKEPARTIYTELRDLAPGRVCPLCGFGYVTTLDHYLPKSKFPLFSVLPSNLVPSCRDCNTGKQTEYAKTAGDQPLHPYFDPPELFSDQWLYAKVEETKPPSVTFFVSAPIAWDPISKNRVAAHFKNYDLPTRLSVHVTNELSSLRYELEYLPDEASRHDHLKQRAKASWEAHRNSWQTALHQALADSEWYCRQGFAEG